jgi:hypothetical protein
LFGSLAAAFLPRFNATSRARPGLTVGSTLDGGPNWADDANCFLVACEVDGRAVITLMRCQTGLALPVFSPPDVLTMPTNVAGLRRREPPVGDHELRPVPGCLVRQLLPWGAQGGIGESTPSGAGTWQALLPQHSRRVQAFDNDAAVSFGQSGCQDVEVVGADIVDPAMQSGHLGGAFTILA